MSNVFNISLLSTEALQELHIQIVEELKSRNIIAPTAQDLVLAQVQNQMVELAEGQKQISEKLNSSSVEAVAAPVPEAKYFVPQPTPITTRFLYYNCPRCSEPSANDIGPCDSCIYDMNAAACFNNYFG
jgi:hypothetical protein